MNSATPTSGTALSVSGRFWEWSGGYTLEAAREASAGTRAFLEAEGLPEAELQAWELIVAELANNLPRHAREGDQDGTWRTQLMIVGDQVTCRITDHTKGFDWPENIVLPNEDSESGRGLFLIQSLSDSLHYCRAPGNNEVTVSRKIKGGVAMPPMDPALIAMTEELSYCYESLSAIFRFIEQSHACDDTEQFTQQLLSRILTVTGACCGTIVITPDGTAGPVECRQGGDSCDHRQAQALYMMQLEAIESRQDLWIYNDPESDHPTGMIHPFFEDAKVMGIVTIQRPSRAEGFTAGEVDMIHTFTEFLRQQLISHRNREEAVKASVTRREVELAAVIQQSLLPTNLPVIDGIAMHGVCECAHTVGGDFYDLIPCGDGQLFFVIADVMGKGVAASLIAATTRSTIRCMDEHFQHPARLLEKTANHMYGDLDELEMFVTIAVGILDANLGVIRIANCGHCPVIIADGEAREASPENPPLGIEEKPEIVEQTFHITGPTSLLAYTDGFDDPRNGHPAFANQHEITDWFYQQTRETRDPKEISTRLINHLRPSSGQGDLADDQTFIAMTIQPPQP